MSSYRYFHNPRCSKSRQGLELVESKNISFEIVEYLKNPMTKSDAITLLKSLPDYKAALRIKEADFKALKLKLDDINLEKAASIISKYPKILERPILTKGKKAIIGRPPEQLLQLL